MGELMKPSDTDLERLSVLNIPKNLYRYIWGFADINNRVGVVTEINPDKDETGMHELRVVVDDPYDCEERITVTSFWVSDKEVEVYGFKPQDLISWDPVFGVPSVLTDEEIDRLSKSSSWRVDALYLLYLEKLC